jgi:hypothetical protein
MSLREELRAILAEEVKGDPLWQQMVETPGTDFEIEGDVGAVLQTAIRSVNVYCDALLKMTLHLADAVDEIRGGSNGTGKSDS